MPASVAATTAIASTPARSTHISGFTYGHSRRPISTGDDFVPEPIGLLKVDLSLKISSKIRVELPASGQTGTPL